MLLTKHRVNMRILVTGHRGYIGSIFVDLLSGAGHNVVGIDSQLYDECTFGEDTSSGVSTIHRDVRELSCSDLDSIDAIAHLAGVCNDPLGDLLPQTTFDIKPQGDGAVGRTCQGQRRPSICLLIELQRLWRCGRRVDRRTFEPQSYHSLCCVQVARRVRSEAARRGSFLPGFPTQRDRLWLLTEDSVRPGAE